eukprot:768723-Hanusia_phi.AAC.2
MEVADAEDRRRRRGGGGGSGEGIQQVLSHAGCSVSTPEVSETSLSIVATSATLSERPCLHGKGITSCQQVRRKGFTLSIC